MAEAPSTSQPETPTLEHLRQAIAAGDLPLARSLAWRLPPAERMRPGAEAVLAELRTGLEERERQQAWVNAREAVAGGRFKEARDHLSQYLMLHPLGANAQEIRRWTGDELPRLERLWKLRQLQLDFLEAAAAGDLRRQQPLAEEWLKLAPPAEELEQLPLLARDPQGRPWIQDPAGMRRQVQEALARPVPPLLPPTADQQEGILWQPEPAGTPAAEAEKPRVYSLPDTPWHPSRPDASRPVVAPGSSVHVVDTTWGRIALAGTALLLLLIVWQAIAWGCFSLNRRQRLWTETERWGRQIGWWHPGPGAFSEACEAKAGWDAIASRLATAQAPQAAAREWRGLAAREGEALSSLQAGEFSQARAQFLETRAAATQLLEELEISRSVVRDARDCALVVGAQELAPEAWKRAERQLQEFDAPRTARDLEATRRLAHESASACEGIVREILRTHVEMPLAAVERAEKQARAMEMDRRQPELWTQAQALADELAGARQEQRYQETLELAGRLSALYYRGALENGRDPGDFAEVELGGGFRTELVWCPAPPNFAPWGAGSVPAQARGFWMARCETTQAQWRAVMGANPSAFPGEARPVENVSWLDVQAFLLKLRQRTRIEGWEARLPTEDEWETACRAGEDEGKAGVWHRGNSQGQTHPVGMLRPNAWGLCDMLGNVWEWVDANADASASKAAVLPMQACRGGGGDDPLKACQPDSRHLLPAAAASNGVGFRLVLSPLPETLKPPDPAPVREVPLPEIVR